MCVQGKTRARDAALNAIQSPLLDIGIERATGIVWNITGGSDLTMFEVRVIICFNLCQVYISAAPMMLLFFLSLCCYFGFLSPSAPLKFELSRYQGKFLVVHISTLIY